MTMNNTLSYRNDNHRRYGATGMAISLVVFDGEDMLAEMSLDSSGSPMMEMTDDFYFSGNQSLSAKVAWNRMLRNFNLTAVMAIGNLLCRELVLEGRQPALELLKTLRGHVAEEGVASCSLEADEIDRLFDKDYNYLYRVFSHSGVQEIAHDFADRLARQRTMTRAEVVEALHAISML